MEPNPQGAYDLESVYAEAVKQLKTLRDNGRLSSSDYDLLTSTKQPQDTLASVDEAATKGSQVHPNAKKRIRAIVEPLLLRLERFGAAIDMVVQSSPQVLGLNLVGLIWGGIKFILVIARDITETFDTVCDVLDDIRKSLPALEVYAKIFGSSDIQLLKAPLVNIYVQLILFGGQAVKLFNRSMLKTLGRSTWISLKEDFQSLIKKLEKAGKEVDRMANVEHLHQSDRALKAQEVEGRKAEAFRQELRWRLAGLSEGIFSGNKASLLSFNDAPVDLITANFIGRDSELQNVTNAFDTNQGDKPARYAIYGMAGLGKSQLALQYSHISFSQERYSHIFWLSATSLEKLNQGFTKVLDLVNHPDRYHPDPSVKLTASRRWLEESGCTKWLLIFDNVEEESVEFIRHHLPRKNTFGNILFTTRTQNIAESVVNAAGQQHLTVELKTLSLDDSAKLLFATARVDTHDATDVMKSKAESLVKQIGCLPLAVDHAGSFMKQCHMGVEDVQNLYDSQQMIQVIGWDNRLTAYEQKSVLAAFSLPLKKLDEISLDMGNFLKTLSFLDTESIALDILGLGAKKARQSREDAILNIESEQMKLTSKKKPSVLHTWKALWRGHKSQPNPTGTSPNDGFANASKLQPEMESLLGCISSPEWIRQTIQELENLSLAKHQRIDNKSSLTMHDLIQVVVQTTASHEDSDRDYYALAITLICSAWWDIEDPRLPKCWSQCEKLIPHINSLTKWNDTKNMDNSELISVNVELGRHFNSKGRYNEAERLQEKVLATREMQCGADHLSTLATVHDLAHVYQSQGRYKEAEILYGQALAGKEKQLGADHPSALITVDNLAQVYERQGRYDEAETLYGRAMAGKEKQLGADHLSTLITVANLAQVYQSQGRYNEAETLYGRATAGKEKQLGSDHLETLITVHNLAQVYERQGRYNEAETLYGRAMAGKEKQLGSDHPETLITLHNLAQVYQSQGRYNEAETMYGQALAGKEKQLGADHPSTLITVDNLAQVYQHQGRNNEAETLYGRAMAGQEKQLGSDHPETLITVANLAQLYKSQGRHNEAETLYRQALAGLEKQLGADHPHTLTAAHNLALFYESQGRHNDNV